MQLFTFDTFIEISLHRAETLSYPPLFHLGAAFRLKLQKFMLILMYPTGGYQGIRESYVVQTRPDLGPDLHLLAKEQSISRHEGDISRLRACL